MTDPFTDDDIYLPLGYSIEPGKRPGLYTPGAFTLAGGRYKAEVLWRAKTENRHQGDYFLVLSKCPVEEGDPEELIPFASGEPPQPGAPADLGGSIVEAPTTG